MFDLEKKIIEKIWDKHILAWKIYFINNQIKNINISYSIDFISIKAKIYWTYIYNTEIQVMYNKNINLSCTCHSYINSWACKHLWALLIEFDSKYIINDNLKIIDKNTNREMELYDNRPKNREDFYLSLNNPISKILMENNALNDKKLTKKILSSLWLNQKITNFYSLDTKKENNLSVFSKIKTRVFESDIENEKLYRIKLSFFERWWIKNINLNLYKSKVQKNWKLSSGSLIKREKIFDLPQKYRWLWSFLESNNISYYQWKSVDDRINFNNSSQTFISTLFNFDEIFDLDNNLINIHREIYNLKIKVENIKDNNYKISLILLWNKSYKLSWYIIFWDIWSKYFSCLDKINNHLMFFYSDLSYLFIKDFNLKWDIILNQDEFNKLKKEEYFNDIVDNALDIDKFWIEYIETDISIILKVEIPDDYSFVKVEHSIFYNDYELNNKNLDKDILKTPHWYIRRSIENEKKENERVLDLIEIYDEFNLNIWKKYIDKNIELFFDKIEELISSWIRVDYKQKIKKITRWNLKISLKVDTKLDFFDIETKVSFWDKELKDAKEILSKAKNWFKHINLDDWNLIILENDISKDLKSLDLIWINEKDVWKKLSIWKYNIGLLKDDLREKWNLLFILDEEAKNLRKQFKDFKKIEELELIKWTKINLRDYQKVWVNFINFLTKYNFSWILADDMGLGKTVQSLAYLEKIYLWNKNNLWRTLIICPTSLVFNWIDEINKFTPNLKADYIKSWKTWFKDIEDTVKIIICSYWVITNLVQVWNIEEIFEYIILDEAQNIKNSASQRAKSISELKSKNRLALSWTPIENNLLELWSIFNFLMPWFLWNLNNFKSNYISSDKEILKILSKKVKPFILRRTKEEVLKDLPAKVEEYIKLEMWDKQKKFYNNLKNAFKLKLTKKFDEDWFNKSSFEILDALLKLRQACLVPELVNLDGADFKDSIKLDYIDENIEDMIWKWHNLLIFSQFTWFLAYVKELLDKKWINYNYLDWQTTKENRKKLVDSFNLSKVNIFIISLKAWWTWLNLTRADYVIHLDPWWNPAVESQATDRAHRMWQEKTVFVQKLIVKDSIEEKILQLQESKRRLIDDVFSWDFSWNFDKKDIDFIFS